MEVSVLRAERLPPAEQLELVLGNPCTCTELEIMLHAPRLLLGLALDLAAHWQPEPSPECNTRTELHRLRSWLVGLDADRAILSSPFRGVHPLPQLFANDDCEPVLPACSMN